VTLRDRYNAMVRWWRGLLKVGGDFVDIFKPRAYVEFRLIHATGPKKGQVAKRAFVGRNVVTSLLNGSGSAPTGGRDMIRRKLVPADITGITGSLADDNDVVIQWCELGTDGTTESAADTGLGAALVPSSLKQVSEVEFDPTNPYVTFVFVYDQTEVNTTFRELVILSDRSPDKDVFARKTFGAFTKTSDFALQVRYTLRL